tara:strand:- start:72 stop:674 length:603 start_codon:yes stop_codon:yes gene_type:complete
MSKQLANNISHMRNDEVIGLAKNRWLPVSVQMAIAKHYYARAHWYLAENSGLDKEVRDYLWSDECNKGYSLKTTMVSYGQYDGEPEKYWELYEKYPGAWTRSGWRMSQAFFGNYWYRNSTRGQSATPTDLLNRIYDDRYDPKKHSMPDTPNYYYGSHPKYQLERLAKHPNLDLELAIKLSQCGIDSVQRLGFDKIVELSR